MSLVNQLFDRYMAELTAGEPEHARVPIARAIFDARAMESQSGSMPPAAASPPSEPQGRSPQHSLQSGPLPPPSERSNPYEDVTAPTSPAPGFGYTRTPLETPSEASMPATPSLSAATLAVPTSSASPAGIASNTTPAALEAEAQGFKQHTIQLEERFEDSIPASPLLPAATPTTSTSSDSLGSDIAISTTAPLEIGAQSSQQVTTQPEARSEASIMATPSLPAATPSTSTSSASVASNMAATSSAPLGIAAQSPERTIVQPGMLSEATISQQESLSVATPAPSTSLALPTSNMAVAIPSSVDLGARSLEQADMQPETSPEAATSEQITSSSATPEITTSSAPPDAISTSAIPFALDLGAQSPELADMQPETPTGTASYEQDSPFLAKVSSSASLPLLEHSVANAMPAPLHNQAQSSEDGDTQPERQWEVDIGSFPIARGLQFGAMPASNPLLMDGTTPALLWQVERQMQDDELAREQTETNIRASTVTRESKHTLQFGSMISPFADETPPPALTSIDPQKPEKNVNTLTHEEAVSKVLRLLAEKHDANYVGDKREIIRRARQFYKDRETSELPPRKKVKRQITGAAYAICELLRYMPRENLMQVLEEAFVAVGTLAESGAEDTALPDNLAPDTTPKPSLSAQESSLPAEEGSLLDDVAMYKISRPVHLKEMGLATYSRVPEELYHTDTVRLARQFLDDTLADDYDAMEALQEAFDRLNRMRGFVYADKSQEPPIRKAAREFVKVFKGVPTGARNDVLDVVFKCCGGEGLKLEYWHARDGETEEERLVREEEGGRLQDQTRRYAAIQARTGRGWAFLAGGSCMLAPDDETVQGLKAMPLLD